jgi:acetyl esterase/lipase
METKMSVMMHKITSADAQAMQAVRGALAKAPKLRFEPAARAAYDDLIAQAPAPESVRFEQAKVGGVPGWWCRPPRADATAATLYLHGGGYVIGSAAAYRNFVGQIAERARCQVFIADYALAPERPFPAAYDETRAMYQGLLALGYQRIALCGDSAGGGLALSFLAGNQAKAEAIVGIAALSPWIDLSLSGESMASRADADPILSREMFTTAATLYLAGQPASDPRVATLDADLSALPPVRIDVGDAEVLLDDALRFARKAERAGVECQLHVWEGMIHVFPSSFAFLQAGAAALDDIAAFLSERLFAGERGPA